MKLTKEIIKKAHKMTREIKEEFPSVDYKFQFGLCMFYLLNKTEETKVEDKKLTAYEIFKLKQEQEKEQEKEQIEEKHKEVLKKLNAICAENNWNAQAREWIKKNEDGEVIYHRWYYTAVWYTGNRHNSKKHEKGFGYWDELKKEYSTEHKYTKQYNVFEY